MKTNVGTRIFEVSFENLANKKVQIKIEHKGRYQTFAIKSAKPWAKMTQARADKAVCDYVAAAPAKRIANLLQYKTTSAVAKLQSRLSEAK